MAKNNIYHKNKTNKKTLAHTEGSLSTCFIAYNGLHMSWYTAIFALQLDLRTTWLC